KQKLEYIHHNPVKDKIVDLPEDYYFSSARNYAGLENDLEVILLYLFGKTIGVGTECNSALTVALRNMLSRSERSGSLVL
ncbi:hypothetical protein B0A56_12845, partial [Flavobacterium columnare NBRC 100251 = ATCC 23463]